MNLPNKRIFLFLIPATFLVILDEWIKSIAIKRFPIEENLSSSSVIDFVVHKNWGLAFDIPFRREFILLISVLIGIFLVRIVIQNFTTHPSIAFASCLILIGALGNVFDRIIYGFTVDYIIFLGRSALNLSDLIIIIGVIALLLGSRKQKSSTHPI